MPSEAQNIGTAGNPVELPCLNDNDPTGINFSFFRQFKDRHAALFSRIMDVLSNRNQRRHFTFSLDCHPHHPTQIGIKCVYINEL